MAQIASEDYPNKLIYLHIDTVTSGFNPALMQQEHRALRRSNANEERKFDPMVTFVGNDDKGGGAKTPWSTRLREGVRIVPYNTDHSLSILNEILCIPDGLADVGVFDRSLVNADVDIDKAYNPVEVIEVATGSGVSSADVDAIAAAVWQEEEALIARKILENKVTKSGDIISIYDDNGIDVWRQYDLANGERLPV